MSFDNDWRVSPIPTICLMASVLDQLRSRPKLPAIQVETNTVAHRVISNPRPNKHLKRPKKSIRPIHQPKPKAAARNVSRHVRIPQRLALLNDSLDEITNLVDENEFLARKFERACLKFSGGDSTSMRERAQGILSTNLELLQKVRKLYEDVDDLKSHIEKRRDARRQASIGELAEEVSELVERCLGVSKTVRHRQAQLPRVQKGRSREELRRDAIKRRKDREAKMEHIFRWYKEENIPTETEESDSESDSEYSSTDSDSDWFSDENDYSDFSSEASEGSRSAHESDYSYLEEDGSSSDDDSDYEGFNEDAYDYSSAQPNAVHNKRIDRRTTEERVLDYIETVKVNGKKLAIYL